MLGLLAYYDLTRSGRVLEAAKRMADQLISKTTGDGGRRISDTGLEALRGLSSCSVLQPFVLLYERTEKERYLSYAENLVASWSLPSAYSPEGLRLLEQAVPGCIPAEIAAPKGYEIMSCYAGVLDLYRVTGKKQYLDAVTAYMDAVVEREIMITGSGSSGELWCEGRLRQTQVLESPMETCVTATYMMLCRKLLEVTHDVKWAERLEVSLFNALAGAMKPGRKLVGVFFSASGTPRIEPGQIEEMNTSAASPTGQGRCWRFPNGA